ncbi:ribosome maturation factor RimM [Rugosimonospora africana]|uniref:Ribosome maturation factor RimM n=1 Tax=Rugosimonospora africana TaxID=556532 RepID=A0A8J3QPW8_9ACTN|nr:ribosome maturation factor RimM [Rugosimonospora africana]GIH13612.1 ribosome maturation factor RimM [Rugosimonospora africana]
MRLVVGQIVRPHGIRGEVVVEVTTDAPEDRFAVGSVLDTDPTAPARPGNGAPERPSNGARTVPRLAIEAVRPHQDRLIIAFEGILDRTAAEDLRGVRLWVDSSDVAEPVDPDEFNDFQLIGLAAVDTAGQRLGEVVRIEHGPAADLLVVRLVDGRDVLVPFVRAIVPTVDVKAGQVVLTPPEGLFEI